MWQGSPHCLQVTLREYQLVSIKNPISVMLSVFTFCFCCLAHYRWLQGVEQTLQANRRRPNGTYVLPTSGCSYFSCHAWCSIQKLEAGGGWRKLPGQEKEGREEVSCGGTVSIVSRHCSSQRGCNNDIYGGGGRGGPFRGKNHVMSLGSPGVRAKARRL